MGEGTRNQRTKADQQRLKDLASFFASAYNFN